MTSQLSVVAHAKNVLFERLWYNYLYVLGCDAAEYAFVLRGIIRKRLQVLGTHAMSHIDTKIVDGVFAKNLFRRYSLKQPEISGSLPLSTVKLSHTP